MPGVLDGQVVAITGGARGIGLATARLMQEEGARVAIGDVDPNALAKAGVELADVVAAPLDVTDPTSFTAFLDLVEQELGPLDVLVNNAGIMPVGRLVDEPDGVTRRMLDINVYGVIVGSKLAAQRMVPRGRGHVVNLASMAGELAVPGLASYCATKHAVVGFTDSCRLEYRDAGVRFSVVMPSFVNTELVSGTQGAKGFKNAEPEDIAGAIVGLITHPRRTRARRTRAMAAMVVAQRFFPRAVNEGLGRALGGDKVFLDDVDQAARNAYEARVRGEQAG